MTPINQVPLPLPADSGDVTEALDVAGSLWKAGNRQDAIRWVRRAAQAADDAGDSQRMSALARASADLEESLSAAPSVAASVPPPVAASVPPPIASSAAPPVARSVAPPVVSTAPPPLPTRPASSIPAPPASASRMQAKTMPPPLPARSNPALPPTVPPENGLRLRVSIKTSTLDPTLMVVRCLEKGRVLPEGTTEGWVVLRESTTIDAAHSNGKSLNGHSNGKSHDGHSNGKSVR